MTQDKINTNGFKEFMASLLSLVHRLVIADFISELIQLFKTDAGFQIIA